MIEKKYLKQFKDFKEKTGYSYKLIASEVCRINNGAKFTAPTLCNWVNGKSSLNLRTLDYLANYIKREGYEF